MVDNGSSAQDPGVPSGEFPHVRLIALPRNTGFGSAANVGVAATSGQWVLLLNPDAWPIGDGVEQLLGFAAARPSLGAVGPVLVGPEGEPRRSTIRPPLGPAPLALWSAFPREVSAAYGAWRRATGRLRRHRVHGAEFLQGAALLVRRRAFEQVGGFDERFFMYAEDADLCAGLREAGWGVELCPAARFVHVGGGSSASDEAHLRLELLRSWLRLIAKIDGLEKAERARRWTLFALRVRGAAPRGARQRAAASWLASGSVTDLLGLPE